MYSIGSAICTLYIQYTGMYNIYAVLIVGSIFLGGSDVGQEIKPTYFTTKLLRVNRIYCTIFIRKQSLCSHE